jgi:hypothetical protein
MGQEYLVIEIDGREAKILWLDDDSLAIVPLAYCSGDVYSRDISSLEKELL